MGRMSRRQTWRDEPASRKTEGAEEFGMMKELWKSQSDGAQGQNSRAGQEEIREIGM